MGLTSKDGLEESGVTKNDVLGSHVEEYNVNFKPIEHPLEPPEDDRPAKCPMPKSSVLNGGRVWKEQLPEGLRKRSESLMANEEGVEEEQPPMQAASKRHHTHPRNRAAPHSTTSPSTSNVFQIFQQCKFDS
ncbi:hypothetical protein QJS10_CPA09g00261 [Acorus calamus]|uniref:Uncharacterized protein n=1 Tax=Acorus calamus TaxID=4465 RepID=A0AAV9E720_ACOCL|nr:hypothetical protein QJS10_CPA09g00261 [Acorus calamus]